MKVWDGTRPMTTRLVVGHDDISVRGLDFGYTTERLEGPTDWCCHDDTRHLIFVHRQGQLHSMETELDWGPSGRGVPRIGDIWVVPAGETCACLVEGDTAAFCKISIPAPLLGSSGLIPRTRHRDGLLHLIVDRLHTVADRGDAMAELLKDSLAEALRLHLADRYANGHPRQRRRNITFDAVTRSGLIEFFEDALDRDISLDAMAALAQMPVGRFIEAFTAAFHTTPYQFLLQRRIERAKALLTKSTRSIAQISKDVGFSTPSYFATAFKQRVGVTPRAYRQSQ